MGERRWDDNQIERFYNEFKAFVETFNAHAKKEAEEQIQQQEMHSAIFQLEDKEKNIPPGLLQMTVRVSDQMHGLKVWQDQQKTFVGGIAFTISSTWFFITDAGPKLLSWMRGL